MSRDWQAVVEEVIQRKHAVELPDDNVAVVPLSEWAQVKRVREMQALADVPAIAISAEEIVELIREQREERTRQILANHRWPK